MRSVWKLVSALAISGCAVDKPSLTKFEALSSSEFTFEARADLSYPADDPKAEATRMGWLEKSLAENRLCPNGYTITGRTIVLAEEGALGQTHNVAYHGICK